MKTQHEIFTVEWREMQQDLIKVGAMCWDNRGKRTAREVYIYNNENHEKGRNGEGGNKKGRKRRFYYYK